MSLLTFAQVVAFTVFYVNGPIFDWTRKGDGLLAQLLSCSLCLGFHVGLWARVYAGDLWQISVVSRPFVGVFLDIVGWGVLVGVTAFAVHRALDWLDAQRFRAEKHAALDEARLAIFQQNGVISHASEKDGEGGES